MKRIATVLLGTLIASAAFAQAAQPVPQSVQQPLPPAVMASPAFAQPPAEMSTKKAKKAKKSKLAKKAGKKSLVAAHSVKHKDKAKAKAKSKLKAKAKATGKIRAQKKAPKLQT